jgi:hypothetical protein
VCALSAGRVGVAAGLLLVLTWSACGGCVDRMPPVCRDHYRASHLERPDLFEYTFEDQIEIYLCAQRAFKLPFFYYESSSQYMTLARNGCAMLPALVARLDRAEDDMIRTELFKVFGELGRFYCDLRERPEVIFALRRAIGKMSASLRRDWCEEIFARILDGPAASFVGEGREADLEADRTDEFDR